MCRKINFPVTLLHITLWNRYLLSAHLVNANNANYEFLSFTNVTKTFPTFLNSKNSINRLFSTAVLVLWLKPVDLFSCFHLKDLEVPWNTCLPSKMQMFPQETCYVIFYRRALEIRSDDVYQAHVSCLWLLEPLRALISVKACFHILWHIVFASIVTTNCWNIYF